MPRPTRRAVGLLFAALLLVVIGTNVQAGWLFVMASLIVGGVAAGIWLPTRMVPDIEVERLAPDEAFAGEDVRVDLVVTNTTRRPRLSIEIRDLHVSPVAVEVPSLASKEVVTVPTVRHAARRGIIDGQPLQVSSGAPFGMAEVKRLVDAPGRTVVYPNIVPIDWLPEVASATKPLEAASSKARKGVGQDFLAIREYQQGDSLRHVHWPSTARLGSLMVREFEQEVPRRLGILVDTFADSPVFAPPEGAAGAGPQSALDVACSVAASLAMHAMRDGHPVALAAAEDGNLSTRPDAPPEEALTWLAGLTAPGGADLRRVFPRAIRDLGRLDTLAVAIPTWSANAAASLVPMLYDLDDADLQVVAFLIDAGSFGRPDKTAPVLSASSVDELTDALAAAHAAVYRIRAEEDLATCLTRPHAA